jgi:Protein of unknown function (DUF1549)/Protein of unknown function (DUF1553)
MTRFVLVLAAAAAITSTATAGTDDGRAVKALAARIDALIAARWKQAGATPAPAAADAVFLRRASLDLIGRVPSLTEVRDFLDDSAADKRFALVRRLVGTDRFATHFAAVGRAALLPSGDDVAGGRGRDLEAWLRQRIKDGTSYDEMARALVLGDARRSAPPVFSARSGRTPEDLASATARAFLGLKLECARCHDHPFDRWKREQFWAYAALFTPDGREIAIPGTARQVAARFPDGREPRGAGRAALAEWLTGGDNPYFARNAVNRLLDYFFGTGLIDPPDETRPDNPPSHPELLDLLAREFAAHKYDVRFLVLALTSTRAYGLGSVQTDPTQADPRLFTRAAVRALTAEQVYDSLLEVCGRDAPGLESDRREEFLAMFRRQGRNGQTSILQALYLMNGRLMEEVTDPARNRALATVSEARRPAGRRIDELYLLTLGRQPVAAERDRLVKYVAEGGASNGPNKAYADIFWALLNSSEFLLNH